MKTIHERYTLYPSLINNEPGEKTKEEIAKQLTFQLLPLEESENLALKSEKRLLYVVSGGTTILYVGEAKGKLAQRFQRGFYAFRRFVREEITLNGYRGYQWINCFVTEKPKEELTVDAFIFPTDFNDDSKRSFVQAVEGELVYLIRSKTQKWPLYQNEIHFYNKEGAKDEAECIYNTIKLANITP